MNTFKISIQGLNKEVTQATGEFESIELGELNLGGIENLLKLVLQVKVTENQIKDKKFCPPNINIEYQPGLFLNFWLNGNVLYCNELDQQIDSANAISLIEKKSTEKPVIKKTSSKLLIIMVLAFVLVYSASALAYAKFNYPAPPNMYVIGGFTFGTLILFHFIYKVLKK